MKKMLLSVVTALTITASAFAATVGDKYERVESTSDLTVGAEYILCYNQIAMGQYNGSKFYKPVNDAVILSSDSKTATIATAGADALAFNIVDGSLAGTYAIKFIDGSTTYYLTCTSISNGNLNRSTSLIETANLNISINTNFAAVINPVKNGNNGQNVIEYNKASGQERFTNYKTGGQQKVTLYKKVTEPVDETKVATPSFSPAEGAVEAGKKVEINCSTDDASIYYTIDGTTPTAESTLYDATTGIIVNEAITIKAIAVKDGLDNSEVATANYTIKKTTVANIAEFISLAQPVASAEYYTIENPVTAVYQNGQNLYVKDNSGWLLIYGSVGQIYNNGDVIAAGIKGQSVNRNNNIQMSNPEASTFVAGVAGTAVEPEEVTAVTAEDANKYVVVKGATISGVSGKDATLKVGTTTIALYNNLGITLTEGTNLTVTGFVNIFGQTVQIVPSEITTATGEEIVAAPTFDPAPGAVEKGTAVTIACATEGATIMYQINDGDLIEYDGQPIIINEATTIGAWAEKEGMADSDVVTAEYTIKAEIPEANKASFDFTKTGLYDKDGNLIGMPASGKGLDLPTVTLTNNHVFISFAQTGSEQKPRIYNSASSSSSGTTLRLYDGNTMTITATGGLKIESIEFTGSTLDAISTETGSYTNGVWTPSAARTSNVESVVFKSSGKPTIKTINVVTSGVYDSVDDIVIDENAPVEYYNLQGVRVANPENGIYIRRQGSKVSKVLVK